MRHWPSFLATALFALVGGCAQNLADFQPSAAGGQCIASDHGVEFRTYFPDHKRYVFISVIAVSGLTPSLYVIADKNFRGDQAGKAETSWWLDRSQPFGFSTDKVDVSWEDEGHLSQALHSVAASDGRFLGQPITDPNRYAFQTEFRLSGFSGDSFDVKLPSVSFDGVTVSPPPVHFVRQGDDAAAVKC